MSHNNFPAYVELSAKEVAKAIADFWERRDIWMEKMKDVYITGTKIIIADQREKYTKSWLGKIWPKDYERYPFDEAVWRYGENVMKTICYGEYGAYNQHTVWYVDSMKYKDTQWGAMNLDVAIKTAKTILIATELWYNIIKLFPIND